MGLYQNFSHVKFAYQYKSYQKKFLSGVNICMKITPLYTQSRTNFTSYRRITEKADGQKIYNTTRMFRRDVNFEELSNFLEEKYGNKPKWNVYSFGCSDCSEVYSLIIEMKEKTGKTDFFTESLLSDCQAQC